MGDVSNKLNKLGLSDEQSQRIGERLKDARTSLNLSLKDLSSKIKIQEPYLRGMEDGHFDILPTPVHGRGLLRVYAKELKVELPELEKKQNSVETLSLNQKSKENNFTVETSKNDIVTPSLHDILGIDVAQKKEKGPEHKPIEKTVPKEKALYPKKPKREITNTTQKIIAPNPLEENAQGNTKTFVKKDQKSISPLREIGKNCLLLLEEIKATLLKNKRRKLSLAIFFRTRMPCNSFFYTEISDYKKRQ